MLSWQFLMFMRFASGIALIVIFAATIVLGKMLWALAKRARRTAALPLDARVARGSAKRTASALLVRHQGRSNDVGTRGGAGRAVAAVLLAALALPAFGSLAASATSWPPRSTDRPQACVAPVPRPPLAGSPSGCAARSGMAPKSDALARIDSQVV